MRAGDYEKPDQDQMDGTRADLLVPFKESQHNIWANYNALHLVHGLQAELDWAENQAMCLL